MKAIRIHRFGSPDVMSIDDIEMPQPGDDQVLIEVQAASVGPWDTWVRRGTSVLPQPLPLTLGSDLTGRVIALGREVRGFESGQDVLGVTNKRFTGAYAEYALAWIGRRIDGPTPHSLEVGHLLADAANSRALYPILQIDLGGASIGRTPAYRLNQDSTEQEVDAYLEDPKAWPAGTFDETPDGVGNPIRILPLFRQDLAAPYGTSGQNDRAEDFGNAVFTLIFDQTNVLSPGGRKFLHALGGGAGDKIIADYTHVLDVTHVIGSPYVTVSTTGAEVTPPFPSGKRVDDQKLLDLNAYLAGLRAPAGHTEQPDMVARGRVAFRTQCTSCHGVDPAKPVDTRLIPMTVIWPGYTPKVIALRDSPLTPIQDSPGTFDDKMIVVDASPLGGPRGNALPLLLDLARKPAFLHDDSVPTLDGLMDPSRGPLAPHPFYVDSAAVRADVAAFLRSLGG